MTNRDQHDECLSAFLDGELRASDVDRLLDVLSDDLTRERLQVWSSVRCAMTQPERVMRPVDISRRVADAIAAPGSARVVVPLARRHWARPAAGFAIAASVLVAVTVTVLQPQAPGVTSVQTAENSTLPAAAPVGQLPSATVVAVSEPGLVREASSKELVIALPQGADQRRGPVGQLDPYLINHVRYGGGYALGGSLGYARVAASTDDADNR